MIMDPPYDRYELMVNGTVVQTPIVLASMAGVVDAEYARARREHAGMVCIGGATPLTRPPWLLPVCSWRQEGMNF